MAVGKAAEKDMAAEILQRCEGRLRGEAQLQQAAEAEGEELPEQSWFGCEAEEPGECLTSCFAALRGLSQHQPLSEQNCLKALHSISTTMDNFILGSQLASGILSRAQLTREAPAGNRHNLLQHQLSLARQAAQMAGGKRTSRFSAWQQATAKVAGQERGILVELVFADVRGHLRCASRYFSNLARHSVSQC